MSVYDKSYDYSELMHKAIGGAMSFIKDVSSEKGTYEDNINYLEEELRTADAIVVGAGSGLSTSAGFTYSGERFNKYFFDFNEKFGISDMYAGGFYPFSDENTKWAWWARHIYYNRYIDAPKSVYNDLISVLKDKEYFVLTTNVDHQFQRAGFDKKRLFYTQGDYGLFQSVDSNNQKTYDNEEWVIKAMEAQGFVRDKDGVFVVPDDKKIKTSIPDELIPKCPDDNSEVTMNLRVDNYFVEDEGWHAASKRYSEFLYKYRDSHVLYLELGVGANTPMIIKFPFWQLTYDNKKAVYACINYNEAFYPKELEDRSICINEDIGNVLKEILKN